MPNPSFENITQCPTYNEIFYAPPWFQPCIHFGSTFNSSSTDVFDTCGSSAEFGVPTNLVGFQIPRTGIGYAGFIAYFDTVNYREYLEVPLSSPLLANKKYCVEFYVSLGYPNVAISNCAAYFSGDSLLDTTNLKTITYVNPQIENPIANMLNDTLNWMLVSGNFIATGGEQFMTIGNFHLPVSTSIQILTGGGTLAYYYIDDVSVVYCDPSGVDELKSYEPLNFYPNPSEGIFHISSTNFQIKSIKIFNVLGVIVYQSEIVNQQNMIDINNEPKGIYFAAVNTEKGILNKKIIIE